MLVVWKGIVENSKDLFVAKWMGFDSFRWEIGNGDKCLFWEDIWCGNRPLRVEYPRELVSLKGLKEKVGMKVLVPEVEVLPRVRSFLWMISIDKLPTKEFLSRRVKSLWLIFVTAACWSTWLARNELVFDYKCTSMNDLVFQSKLRALLWVRAVNEDLRVEERLWVNFYLCGVVNEEDAGIGGVLRDEDGVAMAVFSSSVAAKDSSAVEVEAIIIVLDMFSAMEWLSKSSLSIELGSEEIFCWI
ncbi:hypothetical protein J1N35_026087 [Gossypium stocksii]|uniref:Reverse transcriptase zinc-binding domain-containing protein n=1 Tax=Gossypium stocksii TaxID=47602 RepID=A0A9D3ZYG1_9ROSI|nr:hypothetical protein J1N35_026087 [Gossypium stocksii]